MAAAATSSSRIAVQVRPTLECSSRRKANTTTMIRPIARYQYGLESWSTSRSGCPNRLNRNVGMPVAPSGPPVMFFGLFRAMFSTISWKPSVTIAR